MRVINPANGDVLRDLAEDDAASIAEKCRRARAAQRDWSATDYALRRSALQRFGALLTERREQLARTLTAEVGKADQPERQRAQGAARLASTFSSSTRRRELADGARARGGSRGTRRAHRARAARRRRQHLGLELSVLRRRQRVRAGAAHRQRRAVQAERVCDAHRARDHPGAPRRGRSRRRVRRRRGRRSRR